jgi:murein DD-endopeptidase MepM/ murein hydrolase activator NlpD
LFAYESKLKIAIDPSAIPSARAGILTWPTEKVTVTQYFGKTVSAQRLYVSGSHNGIDLRASIGTPIRAALSGTVTDTEAVYHRSGCQYGKFVLIKHPNGLSTIYGHLSVVSVKPGDTVITGDTIGYSGDTGYATGPHLHFGVYATQGIRIVDSSSLGSSRCAGIKTVASPPAGYLDPMSYLPRP